MNYEKSHLWQTAKSFTFSQKIIDFELEAHWLKGSSTPVKKTIRKTFLMSEIRKYIFYCIYFRICLSDLNIKITIIYLDSHLENFWRKINRSYVVSFTEE